MVRRKMKNNHIFLLFVALGDAFSFSTNSFTRRAKYAYRYDHGHNHGHNHKLHMDSPTAPSSNVDLRKHIDMQGDGDGDGDGDANVNTTVNRNTNTNGNSAAQWHKNRRKQMLAKYSSEILPLEQQSHGLFVGLPLLLFTNASLTWMAIRSAALSVPAIVLMAAIPGSISLWQLQILHDALHSSLLPKPTFKFKSTLTLHDDDDNNNNNEGDRSKMKQLMKIIIRHRIKIQKFILYFGSFPSAYGYYLYLQYGHLTHHKVLGNPDKVSLATLFNSTQTNFEDGDLLFAVHRMKLVGDLGPKIKIPWKGKGKDADADADADGEAILSIGSMGFSTWKHGHAIRNAMTFTATFMFERMMLILNDFILAATGRNYFFPNKPEEFHRQSATYARWAVLVRLGLCYLGGKSWKPLLFLYLAETLWSVPPHPACAMFVTNHGSGSNEDDGTCIPSSSTYAGRWYSLFTLGTNYHVEHHDFPTIPLHKLGKLREIAPEFYRGGGGNDKGNGNKDNLWSIMKKAFAKPEFYACMNAAAIAES